MQESELIEEKQTMQHIKDVHLNCFGSVADGAK